MKEMGKGSDGPRRLVVDNEEMLGLVSECLGRGQSATIMTKGTSMLPFIHGERDSVVLRRMDRYEVGDIVLAHPGRYVLHRIIAIDGDRVTLKGDGNLSGTESCTLGDIRGRALSILKKHGKDVDCTTDRFARRSERWARAPYLCRRYTLAVLRRLLKYKIL